AQELESSIEVFMRGRGGEPLTASDMYSRGIEMASARTKMRELYTAAYKHSLAGADELMSRHRCAEADALYQVCIFIATKKLRDKFSSRDVTYLLHRRISALDGIIDDALYGREYSVAGSHLAVKADLKVLMRSIGSDMSQSSIDEVNRLAIKWSLKAAELFRKDGEHSKESAQYDRMVVLSILLNDNDKTLKNFRRREKLALINSARQAEAELNFLGAQDRWARAGDLASVIHDLREEIEMLYELAKMNGMHVRLEQRREMATRSELSLRAYV
ncbi:MAG: hypothetical protein ACREBW_08785, partial [Candidatus Micrarchaeaceae archaeon]